MEDEMKKQMTGQMQDQGMGSGEMSVFGLFAVMPEEQREQTIEQPRLGGMEMN